MKLPSIGWIGWIKNPVPDITKQVANRTKKELKNQGFIVRQKYFNNFGWYSYYTTPQAIKNYNN